MRFTNETSLTQIMKYSSQRLARIMTVPLTNGYRRLRRIINPNGFTTRVMADVRRQSKEFISGRPQSLADYFSIGHWYVAKKLVVILAVLALILPVAYLKFLHPVIRAKFLTVPMVVNSTQMMGYTGKVRLLASDRGQTLYEGPLSEGRITGTGTLYDYEGNMVYQGGFLMEQYEGSGQTFWPGGGTRYIGEFASNLYEGTGKLYSPTNRLVYEGQFAGGLYNGEGRLYQEDGAPLYTGGFKDGLYDGEGVLYQNGSVLYRGGFKAGRMVGAGTLYAGDVVTYRGSFDHDQFEGNGQEFDPIHGRLLYDGGFKDGKYEGEGRKFHHETGELVYEGGFYQGSYDGEGSLYQENTQVPLYQGGFRAGRYDGTGVEYDPDWGVKRYEGGFLLGSYHGEGTVYDPATGFVLAAGQFRNGAYISAPETDAETPEEPWAPVFPEDYEDPEDTEDVPPVEEKPDPAEKPTPEQPPVKPSESFYTGPVTESGGLDYGALAKLPAGEAESKFSSKPEQWNLKDGGAKVYSDVTDRIGITLRTDKSGNLVSVDIWNDAPVAEGVKVGMTQKQLTETLGEPIKTEKETIGESRLISVSQSNRFFGRLTNLSAESRLSTSTYETATGTIKAMFDRGNCILLEILP